ncbi:MAG: glutamate racemase, partial [Oscillospiraceae bacterium]
QREIDAEIKTQVDNILSRSAISHLILGCTHYPIIEENFTRCYPNLTLINPALEQANAVRDYLIGQQALNEQARGSLTVCTSGDPQVYVQVARRLGLTEPEKLRVVNL